MPPTLRYGLSDVMPPDRAPPAPGVRAAYQARYRDARGQEHTVVEEYSDPARGGSLLRLVVRNVEFGGWSLASRAPTLPLDDRRRERFASSRLGTLGAYAIDCRVPVRVVAAAEPAGHGTAATVEVADLLVHVEVGVPGPGGETDTDALRFTLAAGGREHTSPGDAVL